MAGRPITNPGNIPTRVRPDILEAIKQFGPQKLADKWPREVLPEAVTPQQMATIFELYTQQLWVEEIKRARMQAAVKGIQTDLEETDPFVEESATPNIPAPVKKPSQA